ncbi:MAG: hypothetical protein RR033_06795 [Clostridia bacterium]
MKAEDIKAKLNFELNILTPDVYENVVQSSSLQKKKTVQKNVVENSSNESNVVKKSSEPVRRKQSSKLKWASIVTSVVVVAAIVGGIFAWPRGDGVTPGPSEIAKATYLTVDINPSVEFVADGSGKIKSVRANNEDGEIVLKSLTVDLKGKSLAEGAQIIVEASAKLGYIDVSATANKPSAVKVTAISDGKTADVISDVKSSISGYLKKEGIFAVVVDTSITKQKLFETVSAFDKTATSDMSIEQLTAILEKRKIYYEEKLDELSADNDRESVISSLAIYEILDGYFEDFFEGFAEKSEAIKTLEDVNKEVAEIKGNLPLIDGFYYLGKDYSSDEDLIEPMEKFNEAYQDCLKKFNLTVFTRSEMHTYYGVYGITEESLELLEGKVESFLEEIEDKLTTTEEVMATLKVKLVELSMMFTSLDDLLKDMPSNINEYVDLINARVESEKADREIKFGAAYDKPRAEISEDDYEKVIEDIIKQYGSLEQYYLTLKETHKK